MAPSQLETHNRHHPGHGPRSPKIPRLGTSKAQLCLQKILHIILTVPAAGSNNDISTPTQNDGVPAAKEEDLLQAQSPPAAVDICEVAIEQDAIVDEFVSEEIDDRFKGRKEGGDCMGLLIEAATLIFGGINEDGNHMETAKATGSDLKAVGNVKRKSDDNVGWTAVDLYGDMETEPEPVVRSKRGRTQVLPCKYRDSVIEPLTRVSRSRATLIPNKRRLR